jgi:hypothetical protein
VQQLNEFLKNADYQPALTLGIGVLGLAVCVIVVVSLMHTLTILGQQTLLYRRKSPVKGWSRRLYSASGSMIIFLLMLMWLLSAWSHRL